MTSSPKEKKCTWCGKTAIHQTVRGRENEKAKGSFINDGWFCDNCWKKGVEMENEAMYG